MPKQKLNDQVAIVTGASRGIGAATALALARAGAHLVLAARNEPDLQAVAAEVEKLDRQALVVPTDVTDRAQVDGLVAATLERWGRVDILIANAGQYIRRPVVELAVEDIERALAINFYGVAYAVLAVLPHMLERRYGRIVIMNSMDGKKAILGDAPYSVSKFALTALGEVMRQELRGTGVEVVSIFPGRVDTAFIKNLRVPWIQAALPAESIGRAVVRAVERPRPEVIIPRSALALIYANAISPRFTDWAARLLHLHGWEIPDRESQSE